jgi:hypothetical protein
MSRPNAHHPADSPGSNPANHIQRPLIETGRGQLMALRYQLENIFRTDHPVRENFNAFGHDIRNPLILASTEVEAHWKGVLAANGVKGRNSKDYVKLSEPLKLRGYAVELPFYPWLEPIRPFADWTPSCTLTKDLGWYDAYQAVKHDRENQFNRATLANALQSVCGCAVMLFAQFGSTGFHYRKRSIPSLSWWRHLFGIPPKRTVRKETAAAGRTAGDSRTGGVHWPARAAGRVEPRPVAGESDSGSSSTRTRTCNQTVMSGRIVDALVDFLAFSFELDRVRCYSFTRFLVRNWCAPGLCRGG